MILKVVDSRFSLPLSPMINLASAGVKFIIDVNFNNGAKFTVGLDLMTDDDVSSELYKTNMLRPTVSELFAVSDNK